jgi:predicted Zn-dependent peptidase
MLAVNVLYDVGARDEKPEKTGFAHLFEHLMFGGSKNIPNYDKHVQDAGGENNAFTNNNFTNYYINLPKTNLETALCLESDRMLALDFSEKSLEIQRNVVIEEFKQRYLNQPYGDLWLMLRPLAYKTHPYRWATIGKEISHIENATLADVKEFFYKFYAPNNAILSIVGNIDFNDTKKAVQKWFGGIPKRNIPERKIPKEPAQTSLRKLEVQRDVPFDAIYMAFHMCKRTDEKYYASDLLSDILSNGKSSRLYQKLVKEQKLFSEINAYITGDLDEGLFIITGKLIKGIEIEKGETAIWVELKKLKTESISDYEFTKVKNKVESAIIFSEISILNRAMSLAYFELLGDAAAVNLETEKYSQVSKSDISNIAEEILNEFNCSKIYYRAKLF